MTTALSVCLALGAAALYGVSSVLQQAAAQREGDLPVVGWQVVRRLVRRPRWVLAVSLAGVSFVVQAVALAFGPLALVQPLAGTDLLFALPLLAHRQREALRPSDWGAAGMVVGGVSGFLAVSPPSAGEAVPAFTTWALVLIGAGALVTLMIAVAIGSRGGRRTALLACAGGIVFAVVDALSKAVMGLVGERGAAVFSAWELYALLVAGISGMVLAQGAYRAGPLLISLPIIDTVEPIGAVLIGATAFGEHLGGSPVQWAAQLGAGALAVAGIVVLARSPFLSPHAPNPTGADGPVRPNPAEAGGSAGRRQPFGPPANVEGTKVPSTEEYPRRNVGTRWFSRGRSD